MKKAFFISFISLNKQIGGLIVETNDDEVSVQIESVPKDGEDVQSMGIGKFHTAESMKELGY